MQNESTSQPQQDAVVRLMNDDVELMLWAILHANARWEKSTNEFCVGGLRYGCHVDALGLPDIGDHLRKVLRGIFKTHSA